MQADAPGAPEIYRYYDYHAFLKDHYAWRKGVNPNFSFRYIGGKVGLDAGLVLRIFQGKRPLSVRNIPAFAEVLNLSRRRADYFELLVLYCRSKTEKEAQQYFEKLIGFTGLGGKQVDREQYEFYREWYYTAIREALHFLPFKGDFDALGAILTPAIPGKDARKAIALLESLGMIAAKKDGGYRLTEKYITTGEEWRSFAVREFQRQSLDLARHALEYTPKEERDISTVTLTLDGRSIEKIRERVRRFHQDMLEISEQAGVGDRVYQVNLQVFPMTRPAPEGKAA